MIDTSKSFKNWKAQEVEETFGIKRTWESDILDQWLAERPHIEPDELERAEELRQELRRNIDAWNEAAIKFFFIGPLVSMVGFNTENYHGFLEQTLSIEKDGITARGNVDFMVASGREIARKPFYLLHEYKPETTTVLNPKGQLLIAMLAAQVKNDKAGLVQPIYGTYVIGRTWFLVVLNGNEYTVSESYDVTKADDHATIFRSLFTVRDYIDQLYLKNQV